MVAQSPQIGAKQKEFHIAPMLDVSTPEFCNFFRILSRRAILWTEMVVDETIKHTKHLDHHLPYSPALSPIVCQIGGRDADTCSHATRVVESYGYDEINLNIDCPSSRVSGERRFGAILMKDCEAAYSVVSAMNSSVEGIPISVKTRVGIELEDGEILDTLEHLIGFIDRLRQCGCRKFFIHARKCVIGGLTPAQNRIVPPLNYPRLYDLCDHFPDCEFILNGGIPGLASARLLCHGTGTVSYDETVKNTCIEHEDETTDSDAYQSSTAATRQKLSHCVPCAICNTTNGSCTAPPVNAPPNLVGSMIGRACMENPAMFWDVDRFFYGEDSNPCSNRREALEKYCQYLDVAYPRRCCDSDERKTSRLPAPTVVATGICPICREYNQGESEMEIGMEERLNQKEKITARAIGRSLKPVRGLFFGLRQGKHFRLECDRLTKDSKIRNCGPAFILRKAMSSMPSELLDQSFTKTEDLDNSEVPVHHAPVTFRDNGCRC